MFNWSALAFVRPLLFLILGIVCSTHYQWRFANGFWLLLALAIVYATLFTALHRQRYRFAWLWGLLGFAFCFAAGVYRVETNTAIYHPSHLVHQKNSIDYYRATVVSAVQTHPKTYSFEVSLTALRTDSAWLKATGKVQVYVRKEATQNAQVQYGDVLIIQGEPQPVQGKSNPNDFDFARWLRWQNIYHQHYLRPTDFKKIDFQPPNRVMRWAIATRTYCNQAFQQFVLSSQEAGLASALILGVKEGLDDEIVQAYSNTGTMHVLAVSGMHVGLIFYVLKLLLGWLKPLKGGKVYFAGFVVTFLWFYAFVTGLSASVLRAVLMFSIVAIGQAFSRRTQIYNTLALSAFALLLYDPWLVYSVGFQLSYVAVLGIVYFYPPIYQLWDSTRWRVVDYFWQIICVSIAATLATFPLGVYYFHQFPNYFLLSNVVVLPVSTVALYLGLAFLALAEVPWLNTYLGLALQYSLWLMNQLIFGIEQLPGAMTDGLYIQPWEFWVIVGIILSFSMLWARREMVYLKITLALACLLAVSQITNIIQTQQQVRLLLLDAPKSSAMGVVIGRKVFLWSDSLSPASQKRLNQQYDRLGIQQDSIYTWAEEISYSALQLKKWQEKVLILYIGSKRLLVVQQRLRPEEWDALMQHQPWDYWLIRENALNKLPEKFKPTQAILLDNSNNPFIINSLTEQCTKRKIAVRSNWKEGTLDIPLK